MKTLEQAAIVEGNKIISVFMELDVKVLNDEVCYNTMSERYPLYFAVKYHLSWDWLIEPWVKFVKLYHELGQKGIYHHERKFRSEFASAVDKGDIKKGFEILVTGIKWYNSKTINNGNSRPNNI